MIPPTSALPAGGRTMEPAMALALAASFGSVEAWRLDATAAPDDAAAALQLRFRHRDAMLVNRRVADAADATAGETTLIVLDRGADGLGRSLDDIDWPAVYRRYQDAVHAASAGFGASQDEAASAPVLVDVRRSGVFENAASTIPGARWRDPAAVDTWALELPTDREVIVYCVYGHEVGRTTAMRLRAAGVDARYLEGGIDAWQTAGRPLAAKEKKS